MRTSSTRSIFAAFCLLASGTFSADRADANAIYLIQLSGASTATGNLEFAGDLSTDGLFPLVSDDLLSFDLVVPAAFGTYALSESDFNFVSGGDYVVLGGNLIQIDLQTYGFPAPGGGPFNTSQFQMGSFNPTNSGNNWVTFGTSPSYEGTYQLVAVPEPSTALMLTVGICFMARCKRRRV